MLLHLPLLNYRDQLRTQRRADGKVYLWDTLRKKYLVLQPEEMVRQLLVLYLVDQGYPAGRMSIERQVKVYGNSRRYDLVVMDAAGDPFLAVECKSHDVSMGQEAVDQIALYNTEIKAPYVMVTNGTKALCAAINRSDKTSKLVNLPTYGLKW